MENIKYIQREETRYKGNEFENMPSIDYGSHRSERLNKETKKRIDLAKVKEICNKYGFDYTYINATFGGDDAYFLVYCKIDINVDDYNALVKNLKDKECNKKYWGLVDSYEETFHNIHKCVHELDEQTALMFDCGWQGNCGVFGSDDVYAKAYSGGSRLVSWNSIIDRWAPSINDTTSRLRKGIYIIVDTYHVKPEIQESPLLEDMENTLLDIVRNNLSDKYVANYETGKRQSDNNTYKALIVRHKDGNQYCCMIRFSRDWLGRYRIYHAKPLCGESDWIMDWKNPVDDIRYALGRCAS